MYGNHGIHNLCWNCIGLLQNRRFNRMSTAPENLSLSQIPLRDVRLPPVRLDTLKRPDGSIILQCSEPLQEFDPNIPRSFFSMAGKQAGKTLYAQRRRQADGSSVHAGHLD